MVIRKKLKSLIGERFTRLTVIGFVGYNNRGLRLWLCQCDCGNTKETDTRALTSKHTKSCGCLPTSKIKHGATNTNIYFIWRSIRRRTNPKYSKDFPNYSGRGIKMCDRWQDFEKFYEDMGAGYRKGLSVERIDNNGNYCPANCRWATYKEQNRNKRTNVYYEINGETKCISDWCKFYNINPATVGTRIKRKGMDILSALTMPVADSPTNNYNGNGAPVKKIHKSVMALHTQIGFFCKIGEAAKIHGCSQAHMSQMLSGIYKNKSSFIRV